MLFHPNEIREYTGYREEEKGSRASNKRKIDKQDREELATTKGKEETDHGARLNSLVRWLRGKKRPAETPLDELLTTLVT